MSAVKVRNGDRVRVVLEGEARQKLGDSFTVGEKGSANYVFPEAEHVVSIEVLKPPEPEVVQFGQGDVVEHVSSGRRYIVAEGGMFNLESNKFYEEPESWLTEYVNSKWYRRIELVEKPF